MKTLLPALFASVASLLGCSAAPQSSVQLSAISGARYSQAFSPGVADLHEAGTADVVVACRTESGAADAPPVRQVLHVQVLWQQGHKIKAHMRDVSQNATFHWYVYPAGQTNTPAGRGQVVEYTGTGLVELDCDGEQVTVKIVEAKVAPTTVTRRMADPLGPSKLTGTLTARQDRSETLAMLGGLRATVAGGKARKAAPAVEARLPEGQ